MSLKLFIYLSLFKCIFFATVQEKIYLNAESNIGETAWSFDVDRQAKRNEKVYVTKGEYKCNLFVYEIILASGYDIGTPNKANCIKHPILCSQGKDQRPPLCNDWFNERVPGFNLIGMNEDGKKLCQKGNIITDGHHIGIISNPEDGYTISASTDEVVENDWGYRDYQKDDDFKIFRYNQNTLKSSGKLYNISIILLFLIMIL